MDHGCMELLVSSQHNLVPSDNNIFPNSAPFDEFSSFNSVVSVSFRCPLQRSSTGLVFAVQFQSHLRISENSNLFDFLATDIWSGNWGGVAMLASKEMMKFKSYQNRANLFVKEYLLADPLIPYTSIIGGIFACKMVYDLTQLFSTVHFKSYSSLSRIQRIEWNNR
ncbi:unnamed protein product [Sphenostylis stenocarpa]|uniref:Uncharacterized protein n=1 Tax=Sphenostylis stenocarpa TaxID=92480 RepID=A0AA86VUE7_9FABA|nr:unnamed protein product [Sphenostylis stenocarpa]